MSSEPRHAGNAYPYVDTDDVDDDDDDDDGDDDADAKDDIDADDADADVSNVVPHNQTFDLCVICGF